jgi:hypothetical protein
MPAARTPLRGACPIPAAVHAARNCDACHAADLGGIGTCRNAGASTGLHGGCCTFARCLGVHAPKYGCRFGPWQGVGTRPGKQWGCCTGQAVGCLAWAIRGWARVSSCCRQQYRKGGGVEGEEQTHSLQAHTQNMYSVLGLLLFVAAA